MIKVFNPFTGTFDYIASDAEEALYDARYWKLLNAQTVNMAANSVIYPASPVLGESTNHLGIAGYPFGKLFLQQLNLYGRRTTIGSNLIANGSFVTNTDWVYDVQGDWTRHVDGSGFAPNCANFTKVYGHYLYPDMPVLTQPTPTTKAGKIYRISASTTFTGGSGGNVVVGLGTPNDPACYLGGSGEFVYSNQGRVGQTRPYIDVLCHADGDQFFCFPDGFDWQDNEQSVRATYFSMYEIKLVSIIDASGGDWDAGSSELRCGNIKGSGALYLKSAIYTDTFDVADSDTLCICNKATAMGTTLPPAIGSNRVLYFKNIGAGEVTISGDGADTIDGEATQILYQYETIRVQDIGTGIWVVI